jgi:hypothetical protein
LFFPVEHKSTIRLHDIIWMVLAEGGVYESWYSLDNSCTTA